MKVSTRGCRYLCTQMYTNACRWMQTHMWTYGRHIDLRRCRQTCSNPDANMLRWMGAHANKRRCKHLLTHADWCRYRCVAMPVQTCADTKSDDHRRKLMQMQTQMEMRADKCRPRHVALFLPCRLPWLSASCRSLVLYLVLHQPVQYGPWCPPCAAAHHDTAHVPSRAAVLLLHSERVLPRPLPGGLNRGRILSVSR